MTTVSFSSFLVFSLQQSIDILYDIYSIYKKSLYYLMVLTSIYHLFNFS